MATSHTEIAETIDRTRNAAALRASGAPAFAQRMLPCPFLLIRVHLGNRLLFKTLSVSLWLGERRFQNFTRRRGDTEVGQF